MMPNIFIANIPKKSTPKFTCMPILGTTHEENMCKMFQTRLFPFQASSIVLHCDRFMAVGAVVLARWCSRNPLIPEGRENMALAVLILFLCDP